MDSFMLVYQGGCQDQQQEFWQSQKMTWMLQERAPRI